MFKRIHLNLIVRNWLRGKTYTLASLLSLSIAFISCNLLILFVLDEYNISNGDKGSHSIFRILSDMPKQFDGEKTSFTYAQLGAQLKDQYPEVINYCRLGEPYTKIEISANDYKTQDATLVFADPSVFSFFNYEVLNGKPDNLLTNPYETIITSSFAQKVFGTPYATGENFSITQSGETKILKIAAVVNDKKANSPLNFDVFLPFNEKQSFGGLTFVRLADHFSPKKVIDEINANKNLPKMRGNADLNFYLQPLSEIYFDTTEYQTSWSFLQSRSKDLLQVCLFVALLSLAVGVANYLSINLAQINQQQQIFKNLKMLGAGNYLFAPILGTTLLNVVVSLLISVAGISLILPYFNSLVNGNISIGDFLNTDSVYALMPLFLIVLFIPALILFIKAKRNNATTIRENALSSKHSFSVKYTVTFQFTVAIALLISSFTMLKQLEFTEAKFNVNAHLIELSLENPQNSSKLSTFKENVDRLSGIEKSAIVNTSYLYPYLMQTEDGTFNLWYECDKNFIPAHDLTIIDGRNFTETDSKAAIVNEAYLQKNSINDPIGKTIPETSSTIIGVVKDFYTEPLSLNVKPTILLNLENTAKGTTLQVLLNSENVGTTLEEIEKVWQTVFPNEIFSYSFLEEEIETLHKQNYDLSNMIGSISLISLFITCLGLVALTLISTVNRTKEIGIRKVNGAKVWEVMAMLNRDFVKWVVIGFMVASPIAYYAMNKWLENFAYKTELSWWIFALAGLLALGIALLTVSWQSWKAATRNPVEALRYE